jgi:hypothetical protein
MKTFVKIIFCAVSFIAGFFMVAFAMQDFMAPICRATYMQEFVFPALVIFPLMFVLGLFYPDPDEEGKAYIPLTISGSIIPVLIGILTITGIIFMLPAALFNFGLSSFLGCLVRKAINMRSSALDGELKWTNDNAFKKE